MFIYILFASAVLVALAIILLGIRILLRKKGEFPSMHIGDNAALRKKGITCVKAQDWQAQNKN
jgi:hypothetical protein